MMTRFTSSNYLTLPSRQSGAAFLLFIVIFTLSATSLVVAKFSRTQVNTARVLETQRSLHQARDALLGYALDQFIPGLLPCPDIDGDGESDASASGCQAVAAWLPFRTLGLDDLKDATGARLWYAVDPQYTTGLAPFNSSSASNLQVNNNAAAFVVLAANTNLDGQIRAAGDINRANYFEGVSGDNDPFRYQQSSANGNNDQLVAQNTDGFWALIENSLVLPAALDALRGYYFSCSALPWAANFNDAGGNSVTGLQQGAFPFGVAQDSDNSGCALTMSMPAWLPNHWGRTLQYSFCLNAQGQCLSITGDVSATTSALVIGPGPTLAGQSRPSTQLSQYFESANQFATSQFLFRLPNNHDGSFNDVLLYLP